MDGTNEYCYKDFCLPLSPKGDVIFKIVIESKFNSD